MNEKYVFLDRDGVINKDGWGWTDHGYIKRWEDFHFLPRAVEALKRIAEAGYKCVIISNQAGVGQGYYTKEALSEVTDKMLDAIKKAGGNIAGVYYCTHAKEEGCDCRKPKPGLLHQAKKELGIQDVSGKYYVGDTERDIQAGKSANLKTVLLLSGKTSAREWEKWEQKPDHVCKDLLEAADLIIKEGP